MIDLNKFEHEVKIADPLNSSVFKDECLLCFDDPETSDGIYVCLDTFYGFDKQHLLDYFQMTGKTLFLNITREEIESDIEPKEKIKKMAIGVDGGFQVDKKLKFRENYKLVSLPTFEAIYLPCDKLPIFITDSINSIIKCDSVIKLSDIENEKFSWDGESRPVTKHTNLVQLSNPPSINIKESKCQECNLKENLWLNLTDGAISCGRKNFDGTGGNNHAMEHYQLTKYPLVVKIGTITKMGGDVYSYDENDMVEDPNLLQHLSHFNISMDLEKTDKTISELEIEMNENYKEWATIQESSQTLKPIYGKGYTGIHNLGNTCYISSVLQIIFSLPDFQKFFYDDFIHKMLSNLKNPLDNFNFQTSKVAYGLLSGKYSIPPTLDNGSNNRDHNGIKPKLFNLMIKKSYSEFRNNKQQDAHEFFLHFMNQMEKCNFSKSPPSNLFKFFVEEKWQCTLTNRVKYTKKLENYISILIPLNKATNKDEYEKYLLEKESNPQKDIDKVLAKITFKDILGNYFAAESIQKFENVTSSLANADVTKISRLATFPKYLIFHMKRYVIDKKDGEWLPKKLDASIENVPLELNLEEFCSKGLQAGEVVMPDTEPCAIKTLKNINKDFLKQLEDMGFNHNLCERGLTNTNNASIEDAFNWIIQHLDDPCDVVEALPTDDLPDGTNSVCDQNISSIMDMGFSRAHALRALIATNDNVERALDWLFSHQGENNFDAQEPCDISRATNGVTKDCDLNAPELDTGNPLYKLAGCLSHIGNSLNSGHYVSHIIKDDKWVIFNDNYVALSANPPLNLAYMYIYKRM